MCPLNLLVIDDFPAVFLGFDASLGVLDLLKRVFSIVDPYRTDWIGVFIALFLGCTASFVVMDLTICVFTVIDP